MSIGKELKIGTCEGKGDIREITDGSGRIILAGKTWTIRTYLNRDRYPAYLGSCLKN